MAAKRLTDLLDFLTSLGTVISDDDPEKKDKQKALLRGCLVDFKTGLLLRYRREPTCWKK